MRWMNLISIKLLSFHQNKDVRRTLGNTQHDLYVEKFKCNAFLDLQPKGIRKSSANEIARIIKEDRKKDYHITYLSVP